MARQRDRDNDPGDKGKNLGQGLAGITDTDRRDLGGGERARTKDQRQTMTSGEQGAEAGRRDAGDRDRKR